MVATTTKNEIFSNPLLLDLNKYLKDDGSKISHVKKVVVLISDEKSVSNSEIFLKKLEEAIKGLPKDDLNGLSKAKSYTSKLKKESTNLSNLFAFTSKFVIDEKNVKMLLSNLQKASGLLNDMIEYMNFAIKSQEAVEAIKVSPKLTFDELKDRLN